MKKLLCAILLSSVPTFSFSEESIKYDDLRTYLIINLDKKNINKFTQMLDRCGGRLLQVYNQETILVETTVKQAICIAETTEKIIIEIRQRVPTK